MARQDEPRSKLAIGMDWAARVTTVGLEFVLPTLGGVAIDQYFHTLPMATLIGVVLGFGVGMASILKIAREGTTR